MSKYLREDMKRGHSQIMISTATLGLSERKLALSAAEGSKDLFTVLNRAAHVSKRSLHI